MKRKRTWKMEAPVEAWPFNTAWNRRSHPQPEPSAEEVREACAKVCDEGVDWQPKFPPAQRVSDETCRLLAKAIRALDLSKVKP
mgnify:CR=1 FL=1